MIRRENQRQDLPIGTLNPGARFHHTIEDDKIRRFTFGGLHRTRDGAVKAQQKMAEDARGSAWKPTEKQRNNGSKGYSQASADEDAAHWESLQIIELEVGEEYQPFGSGGEKYVHGVNDGTHGSTLNDKDMRQVILRGS